MFLRMLRHVTRKYRWKCHAYCLMSTPFHLVVTTPEPNIGRCMQSLNSVYAREFNKRYGRLGHLVSSPVLKSVDRDRGARAGGLSLRPTQPRARWSLRQAGGLVLE